jgi:hypothetical protein
MGISILSPITTGAAASTGVAVAKDGALVGTRPRVDFRTGTNTTLSVTDDAGVGEVNVTYTAVPASYVFTQGTPANPWVINHNLGFYPNVTVVDSGGSNVEGDISYPSVNQMQISFSGAFSGTAYLS